MSAVFTRLPACLSVLLCAMLAGACSDSASTQDGAGVTGPSPEKADRLSVAQAGDGSLQVFAPSSRIMPAMGAVYLEIANTGTMDDRLTAVRTFAADSAELHESVETDGMVRMRHHPDGFPVPAGGSLVLAPGGKHMMLMAPCLEDDQSSFQVTLIFEKAGPLVVDVPVGGI